MIETFDNAQDAIATMDNLTLDNYFACSAHPSAPATTPWSKSSLFKVSKDPASWMANLPFKTTDKMRFGSLVDDYLFWPSKFRDMYDETSDCPWNKNPGKAEATAIRAKGKTPVKPKEMDRVREIESRFRSYSRSDSASKMLMGENQYITKGAVEVNYTMLGEEKVLFLPIKGLLDSAYFTEGSKDVELFDMKITSAEDVAAVWDIYVGLGYHWQEVIYSELMKVNGWNPTGFKFVFCQAEEPHQIWVAESDENLKAAAKTGISRALLHIIAITEGWRSEDFEPEVIKFGIQSRWRRFAELPDELMKEITLGKVEFHG